MIDLDRLSLYNFTILKKWSKQFECSGLSKLSDIYNYSVIDFSKKMNLGLQDSLSLFKSLQEIKNKLVNNTIFEIYDGDLIKKNNEESKNDIACLNLSVRSYNALKLNCINTVNDLLKLEINDLIRFRNLGKKSIKEIISVINMLKEGSGIEIDNKVDYKTYLTIDNLNLSRRTYNCLMHSGLINVDDFINYTKYDFYNIENMGEKSVDEIYNILNNLKKEYNNGTNFDYKNKIVSLKKDVSDYIYHNIKLSKFNISEIDYDLLMRLGITSNNTFYELFKSIDNAINESNLNITEDEFKALYDFIYKYLPIQEKFIGIIDITDDDKIILYDRCHGKTLEEIGKTYNVSRERIRQKESSIKKKIKCSFSSNKLERFLLNDYFYLDSKTGLPDELYALYFNILDELLDVTKIEINEQFFYVSNTLFNKSVDMVDRLKDLIDKNGFVFEYEFDYSSMDNSLFSYLLDQKNIYFNGKTFYLKRSDSHKVVDYIKRFGSIDLSSSNLGKICEELREYLDILNFDRHNIISSVTRKGVISIGESKYCLLDSIPKIDKITINKILKFIEKGRICDCSEILNEFKNELPANFTPETLYFSIKQMYPNEYNYGGTNLVISLKEMAASKASSIYNFLSQQSEPISNTIIMNYFRVDKTALSVIDSQNTDIFYIDDVNLWLYSKMPDIDYILDKMKLYICSKNSFFVTDFYKYMRKEYEDILQRNFITSLERFSRLIKSKCSDLIKNYEYDRFKKYYFKKQIISDSGFDFDF